MVESKPGSPDAKPPTADEAKEEHLSDTTPDAPESLNLTLEERLVALAQTAAATSSANSSDQNTAQADIPTDSLNATSRLNVSFGGVSSGGEQQDAAAVNVSLEQPP